MEINRIEWYKPMQIAIAGWITTPGTKKLLSIYSFILKEIEAGNLKAKNYARGKAGKKYFMVKGDWILDYLEKFEQ